jgi:hypothetical protein
MFRRAFWLGAGFVKDVVLEVAWRVSGRGSRFAARRAEQKRLRTQIRAIHYEARELAALAKPDPGNCPACGARWPAGGRSCPNDGTPQPVGETTSHPTPPRNRGGVR